MDAETVLGAVGPVTTQAGKMTRMTVIKRDGAVEPVHFDKVLSRIDKAATGLRAVDTTRIAQQVVAEIVDGIHTSKLDELTGEICAMKIPEHPEYGTLAARIEVSNLQKMTPKTFSAAMMALADAKDVHGKPCSLVNDEFLGYVRANGPAYDAMVVNDRDYLFEYFGLKTLQKGYLHKVNDAIVERPQYLWMRVAVALHGNDLERVRETYDLLSQQFFTHATPTLFNMGTQVQQGSSCFLLSMKGDSIDGIFQTLHRCAMISKLSGGIGLAAHNVRASGSHIRSTNGKSSGLVPMLRVFNDTARYVDQAGKRKGSFAIYLEPWHADIEAFLQLKKNTGTEEERARDLFLALWVPDLFMKRVDEDGQWTLMCPDECPGLSECWGEEFEKLYCQYEAEGRGRRSIKARTLWMDILESQIETGVPYLLSKDAANRRSNQKNLGTIKSSNLCVAPETPIRIRRSIGGFPCEACGHYQDQFEHVDVPIASLKDQWVEVFNGEEWSKVTVRQTGVAQKLIRVTVTEGYGAVMEERIIDCTPYHKFIPFVETSIKDAPRVEAKDLVPGMELARLNDDIPVRVKSVLDLGRIDDTYCFTEPLNNAGVFNGILLGNCAEVIEYTDSEEIAVCNLASIGLPRFVERGRFNFDKLREVTGVITRNLNVIIDKNYYPVEETRTSNLRHRPIGIGIQGLADTFAMLKMPFDSPEAAALNRAIAEHIYFAAIDMSCRLAEQHGPYDSFVGSPASQGQFQFDMWPDEKPRYTADLPWELLRQRMVNHGLRNSLCIALMPTASTSQILGNNESFEPFTSNLYVRRVLAGEFICANKHLVRDLEEAGLWTPTMQAALIRNKGRVTAIEAIPQDIRERYKTVWEIKQRVVIDQARDRAPFVCQSQSMNLFYEKPSNTVLSTALFYAWRKGLVTLNYYIRTQPSKAQAFEVQEPACATCTA